jgi:hypothetical protein
MLEKLRCLHLFKLPVLLLACLLCVQSIAAVKHDILMISAASQPLEKTKTPQTPPCHDMADLTDDRADADHDINDKSDSHPACCDSGTCSNAHCMMPAGMHFDITFQNYFLSLTAAPLALKIHTTPSINASPPVRPPIA